MSKGVIQAIVITAAIAGSCFMAWLQCFGMAIALIVFAFVVIL